MSSLVFLDVNVSVNVYGKYLNIFFDILYNYLFIFPCHYLPNDKVYQYCTISIRIL